jgi:hypothetical protein
MLLSPDAMLAPVSCAELRPCLRRDFEPAHIWTGLEPGDPSSGTVAELKDPELNA